MKYLRMVVFTLAVAAVSLGALPAFSQQEIDPDHFDQPIASKPAAKPSAHKAPAQQKKQGKTHPSRAAKPHTTHTAA